jgi:2-keto-4-pentenoate hydratase/2-oxohepta-3-ene-1,7-dioic acid hydratase in catechol pathway
MKLLRFGPKGNEKPGLLDGDGLLRDLSGVLPDLTSAALGKAALGRLAELDPRRLPVVEEPVRMAPIVADIGKLICVGLNYSDHAAESGMAVPAEPVLFTKATSSIIGCNDPVVLPRDSIKSDWEVELGVVIGTRARYVAVEDALDHVAGYCVVNDLSEREYQLERGGQWDKGKGCDTFGPVGPWLVTSDEVSDPQNLDMWLELNGKRYQTPRPQPGEAFIARVRIPCSRVLRDEFRWMRIASVAPAMSRRASARRMSRCSCTAYWLRTSSLPSSLSHK